MTASWPLPDGVTVLILGYCTPAGRGTLRAVCSGTRAALSPSVAALSLRFAPATIPALVAAVRSPWWGLRKERVAVRLHDDGCREEDVALLTALLHAVARELPRVTALSLTTREEPVVPELLALVGRVLPGVAVAVVPIPTDVSVGHRVRE